MAKKPEKQAVPSKGGVASKRDFREQLCKSLIALPLLAKMKGRNKLSVVIDLNYSHLDGLSKAKHQACLALAKVLGKPEPQGGETLDDLLRRLAPDVNEVKTDLCPQYVFAEITPANIRALLAADNAMAADVLRRRRPEAEQRNESAERVRTDSNRPFAHDVPTETAATEWPHYRGQSIYKIWPDFDAKTMILKTVSTIKADAARISFSATGRTIVWAVIDSGIDAAHPHFKAHQNLVLPPPLQHADFTKTTVEEIYLTTPPQDAFGHGTHVAGIIAGEFTSDGGATVNAVTRVRDNQGNESHDPWPIDRIAGIAPECKLLSLKVLDEGGRDTSSRASNILAALAYINKLNAYGRNIQVHGVNLSVGYEFDPEWFGCGQSPLCVEVNRLVSSGVVVVCAAGNTGYGSIAPMSAGPNVAGLPQTINDPGNADKAITVGSTHRYMPQQYGVSYFSSKGPTGDGRLKPDLVAPGENVLSCAAGVKQAEIDRTLAKRKNKPVAELTDSERCSYREESGTSMAAPHVSGAIAAFLSIRPGYIGCPYDVKTIFLSTATDLGRQRDFQGNGLVDLMRAIQSV